MPKIAEFTLETRPGHSRVKTVRLAAYKNDTNLHIGIGGQNPSRPAQASTRISPANLDQFISALQEFRDILEEQGAHFP